MQRPQLKSSFAVLIVPVCFTTPALDLLMATDLVLGQRLALVQGGFTQEGLWALKDCSRQSGSSEGMDTLSRTLLLVVTFTSSWNWIRNIGMRHSIGMTMDKLS